MERPSAGPTVRAGKNGLIAKLLAHSGDFVGYQTFCFVPRNRHKRLSSPAGTAPTLRPVVEITFSHHRLRDPTGIIQCIDCPARNRRRRRVGVETVKLTYLTVTELDLVGTPVIGGVDGFAHVPVF